MNTPSEGLPNGKAKQRRNEKMNRYEGYEKKSILKKIDAKKRYIVYLDAQITSVEEDLQELELQLQRIEEEE